MPIGTQAFVKRVVAKQAAQGSAASQAFGFLSPMSLVSYGAMVGLHFLSKAVLGKDPQLYDQRRTTLQLDPQWPSRRIFGRVEVGGKLFWANTTRYPWSGTRSSRTPVWRPPTEGLESYIPPVFNQRVVLLDRAVWLCEGTANQIDYVRVNGDLVKVEPVVLDGVTFYTPVRNLFRYHSSVSSTRINPYYRKFYIRAHFGVDRTDAELLARYSKSPELGEDTGAVEFDASGNQKVGYWHAEKKDANHSWVALTLIDDDSEFWDGKNLQDFSFILQGQSVTDMRNPNGGLVFTDNAAAVQHWIETNMVEGQDASSVSLRHFQEAYNWCAIQKENNYEQYFELPDGHRREASQGERASFYRDMPSVSKNGTLNIILEEGDTVDAFRENCDSIRQGFHYSFGDRLCVTVGKNLDFSHATTIDNADIVSIRPEPQPRQSDSPNTLQARMASSQGHGYEPVDIEISDSYAIERDGRPIIRSMGTLDGQTDYMEVARRMTSMVYRQRFQQRYRVTLLPQKKYLSLQPNDGVYLNSRLARKENYRCRVMGIEIAENGQLALMLRYAPPNEFIDQGVLPPIEQLSEGLPTPLAVTDVTVHGSPGTKPAHANVELEWPSSRYYQNTIIRWREDTGRWHAGMFSSNNRGATQRQALNFNFKIGTTYEFELVNQNRNGDLSDPYVESWVATDDTVAPPAPSGVVVTGILGGMALRFTPVDTSIVTDYGHTDVIAAYTLPGDSEATTTVFTMTGSSQSFGDLVPTDAVVPIAVTVVHVDTNGNESVPVVTTVSSVSTTSFADKGYPGHEVYNLSFSYNKLYNDGFGIVSGVHFPRISEGSWWVRLDARDSANYDIPWWKDTAATSSAAGEEHWYRFNTSNARPVDDPSGGDPPSPWRRLVYPIPYPSDYSFETHGAVRIISRTTPRTGSSDAYGNWVLRQGASAGGAVRNNVPVNWKFLTNITYSDMFFERFDGEDKDIRYALAPMDAGAFITLYWDETRILVYRLREKPRAFRGGQNIQDLEMEFVPESSRYDNPLTQQELLLSTFEVRIFSSTEYRPPMLEFFDYDDYSEPSEVPADPLTDAGSYQFLDGTTVVDSHWDAIATADRVTMSYLDANGVDRRQYLQSVARDGYIRYWISERQWYEWKIAKVTAGEHTITFEFVSPSLRAQIRRPDIPNTDGYGIQFQFSIPSPGAAGDRGVDGTDGAGWERRFTVAPNRDEITDSTKLLLDSEPYDPVSPTDRNGQIWTDGASVLPTLVNPVVLGVERRVVGTFERDAAIPANKRGPWSRTFYATELGKDGKTFEWIFFQNDTGRIPALPVLEAPGAGEARMYKLVDGDYEVVTAEEYQEDDFVPTTLETATGIGEGNEDIYGVWQDNLPPFDPDNPFRFYVPRKKTGGHNSQWQPFSYVQLFLGQPPPPRTFYLWAPSGHRRWKTGLVWDADYQIPGARTRGAWKLPGSNTHAVRGEGTNTAVRDRPIVPGMQASVDAPIALPIGLHKADARLRVHYEMGGQWFAEAWTLGMPAEADLAFARQHLWEAWCCTQEWVEASGDTKGHYGAFSQAIICGESPLPPGSERSVLVTAPDGTKTYEPLSSLSGGATQTPNVPTGASISARTARTLTMGWSPPIGGDTPLGYRVDVSTSNTFPAVATTSSGILAATARSWTTSVLNPNTTYHLRVYAVIGDNTSATAATTSGKTYAVPVLTSSNIQQTTGRISWTAGEATLAARQLQRRTGTAGSWATIHTPTTNAAGSYNDSGLTARTQYQYRMLQGTDVNNASEVLSIVTAIPTAPPAPTPTPTPTPDPDPKPVLYLTATGSNTLSAVWDAVSGSGSYRVEWGPQADSGYAHHALTTATSYNISGLDSNTAYKARVRRGSGPWSEEDFATTDASAPNLNLSVVRQTTIKLSWSGGDQSSGTWDLDRSTDNETWVSVLTNTASTSHTASGLQASTLYYFRVRRNDTGPYGTVSATTTAAAPVPTAETAPSVTTGTVRIGSVNLVWSQGTGTSGNYTVQYKKRTDNTYTTASSSVRGTSYTVDGLDAGTTYDFRVGQPDEPWGVTSAVTLHSAPVVEVTSKDDDSITFSAIGGSRSGPYAYAYKISTGTVWQTVSGTTISGLLPNTTYNIRVSKGGGTEYGTTSATTDHSAPRIISVPVSASIIFADISGGSVTTGLWEVQIRKSGAGWPASGTKQSSPFFAFIGLDAGSDYEFRGRRGNGPWSDTAEETTFHKAPSLSVTINGTTANLLWSGGSVSSGSYTIWWKEDSQSWDDAQSKTDTASPGSVTGLTRGKTYDFRVQRGSGPYSTAVSGTVDNAAPSLSSSEVKETTTRLSWSGGSVTSGVWQLQGRRPTDQNWRLWGTIVSGRSTIVLTGLRPGVLHRFRIRRQISSGTWGPWSSEATFTTEHSAANISARVSHHTTVTASWGGGSITTGQWTLQIRTKGNAWSSQSHSQFVLSGTSKSFPNKNPNTTYEFRVKRGNGPWSDTASATTHHTAPTLTVSDTESNSVDLSWTGGSVGSGTYTIYYAEGTSPPTAASSSKTGITGTSTTITGLTPNTTYSFRVTRGRNNPLSDPRTTTTQHGFSFYVTARSQTTISTYVGGAGAVTYRLQLRGHGGEYPSHVESRYGSGVYTWTHLSPNTTYDIRAIPVGYEHGWFEIEATTTA